MEKIEGAKLVGKTWHYNKRVPKRLVEAFGLPAFKRGTMKTKDPDVARRLARAMLVELDALEAKLDSVASRVKLFDQLSEREQVRVQDEVAQNVSKLPSFQRQIIEKYGTGLEAVKKLQDYEASLAFVAGTAGAEFALKDELGEEYNPDEREIEEATDKAFEDLHLTKAKALREALAAAEVLEGAPEPESGLSALLERYCTAKEYIHAKGVKSKTRSQYEYAVRRFNEYHGNLALTALSRKHLADFSSDFLKLPVSSRKDIRPLGFHDAVAIADKEDLRRVSVRTRDQNLTLLKSLMAFAVREGDVSEDPWATYMPTMARSKHSSESQKKKHVFSRDEVKRIAAHAMKTRDSNTVDYWGPLFGAFHGLRLEEVAQLRVDDISTKEGFLCLSVTDEGEFQKVKNKNSFRTIPLHSGLLKLGFSDFVKRRQKAAGDMLFMESKRWGGELHEIGRDGQGRYGTNYGSRFRLDLSNALAIEGHKVGYHSFRHAWTDLARDAGIHPEQRRALAGRESNDDRDGFRTDRTENQYGHGFSIKVLAASLNKLRPLD